MNLINKIVTPIYALEDIKLGDIKGPNDSKFFDLTKLEEPGALTETLVSTIISVLTVVAGIAFLIYFLMGGLTWITAGGDKNNTAKAQKQMTDAAIGLITVVVAYFIAGIIGTVMGIDILNPASMLQGIIKQ